MKKRENEMIPFIVLATLAFLIATVVLIKNFAPVQLVSTVINFGVPKSFLTNQEELLNSDGNSGEPNDDSDLTLQANSNSQNSTNSTVVNNIVEGDGGAQQVEYEFNKTYLKTIQPDASVEKIDLYTTVADCDYRFFIKGNASDNRLTGTIKLSVYNADGIKVEEETFSPDYSNSFDYCDEFQMDMRLESIQKYTLKIDVAEASGEYSLCVLQLPRDAGYDEESALEFVVGQEVSVTLNSSLSDWYVCNFNEVGRYKIVCHNIDVGCRVNVSGTDEHLSVFNLSVKNEDSKETFYNVLNPRKITVEVKPENNNANGKCILLVEKIEE